jgi:hypothetical protein
MRIASKLLAVLAIPSIAYFTDPIAAQKKDGKNPPRVIVALPLAIELGKTTKLTLRGLRLDTVTGLQVQEPKSSGRIIGKARKVPVPNQANPDQVGDSEIDIEISVGKETPGNVVPFVVIGPGGESTPHRLIVKDDAPIIVEKEPNDGFKQAQAIAIPCVVEGSIGQAQDVDVFRFEGKKGEKLVFEIQANRFGSPLDGMLTLFDADGRIVATADDSPDSLDPTLKATLQHSGAYFISLIDAHDQGGSIWLYRLAARRAE